MSMHGIALDHRWGRPAFIIVDHLDDPVRPAWTWQVSSCGLSLLSLGVSPFGFLLFMPPWLAFLRTPHLISFC